jgi:biopolymer transport protein ExbD
MALDSGFDDRGARLEMIPLMDVVFLLLVFFIYAMFTMSVHRGVRVDLPRAGGAAEHGDRVVITLTADNRIALNGDFVPLDDAVIGAVELWRAHATPVLISADRLADIGPGIELLAKLKNGGVETVAFQVEAQ